jgi:hypothetical protein
MTGTVIVRETDMFQRFDRDNIVRVERESDTSLQVYLRSPDRLFDISTKYAGIERERAAVVAKEIFDDLTALAQPRSEGVYVAVVWTFDGQGDWIRSLL